MMLRKIEHALAGANWQRGGSKGSHPDPAPLPSEQHAAAAAAKVSHDRAAQARARHERAARARARGAPPTH